MLRDYAVMSTAQQRAIDRIVEIADGRPVSTKLLGPPEDKPSAFVKVGASIPDESLVCIGVGYRGGLDVTVYTIHGTIKDKGRRSGWAIIRSYVPPVPPVRHKQHKEV